MKQQFFGALALAMVLLPAFSIVAEAGGALQQLVQVGAQDVYILPKDCADAGLKTQKECDALHAGATRKSAQACNAEYAANKAALKAAGETRGKFIADCRAGKEVIPTAGAAATIAKPVAPTVAPVTTPTTTTVVATPTTVVVMPSTGGTTTSGGVTRLQNSNAGAAPANSTKCTGGLNVLVGLC